MAATHINLPNLVVGADAPNGIQYMTTDLNDTINRVSSVVGSNLADTAAAQADIATLQGQVATLQGQVSTLMGQMTTALADIATLQASAAIYDVGAYGR